MSAIQLTGRDAILRGSGASNSAAVCILETPAPEPLSHPSAHPALAVSGFREPAKESPVKGLARLVQISKTTTLIDLTIRGLEPGRYHASIRETGDISRGVGGVGGVWAGLRSSFWAESGMKGGDASNIGEQDGGIGEKGVLGTVEVGPRGAGNAYLHRPVQIWEVIGRGMVVSRSLPGMEMGMKEDNGNIVLGVIARSAGVWDNDKTVCSCSGKTVWEERDEMRKKGIN